jgi:hypothetical protein
VLTCLFCRDCRPQYQMRTPMATRRAAPPIAIPAMAPVDSELWEDGSGEGDGLVVDPGAEVGVVGDAVSVAVVV